MNHPQNNLSHCWTSRTNRWKGNLRISRSVVRWYRRISRSACVPGRNRCGFLTPDDGADLRATSSRPDGVHPKHKPAMLGQAADRQRTRTNPYSSPTAPTSPHGQSDWGGSVETGVRRKASCAACPVLLCDCRLSLNTTALSYTRSLRGLGSKLLPRRLAAGALAGGLLRPCHRYLVLV